MQDGSIHADSNTILSALERPSINIYAELLLNLQQVTIFASLNSSSDGKTSLKLSPDLKNISLSHDGEITHLRLPAKVTAEAPLKLPTAPVKELSFRLPIAEHGHPAKLTDATAGNIVPWSADSLTPTTQISCRHCNSIILEQPSVKVWKDLPSENWAEMMDFWHCHKPENEGHDDIHKPEDNMDGSEKGYTAASRLLAKPGVGFVDLCHFLLAKEDCSEIEIHNKEHSRRPDKITCSACQEILGVVDNKAEGLRLDKWSLLVRVNREACSLAYAAERFVAAQLLEIVENQAVRKFVVRDDDSEDNTAAMILWVFTPDLRYSTSAQPDLPKRAMKILYQRADNPRYLSEKQTMSSEELYLPPHILKSISKTLQESTAFLPVSARKFQNWTVGLLERFDSGS